MKERCRVLEEEKRILEANQPRKSAKGAVPDAVSAFDGEIQTIGKKFGIMAEMFFPVDGLFTRSDPLPPPLLPFNTPARYASARAEEDAVLTELDNMLPDHLRTLRTTNHFSDVVSKICAFTV